MHQSFLENYDGTRIAVYDNLKKDKPAILFLHGNSVAASVFAQQFNDAGLDHYHLFAIDLPGHGNSAKAADPATGYSMKGLIRTLDHIVPKLQAADMVVACYSLSAHVVMENENSPGMFAGAFCFGYPPLSDLGDLGKATGTSPALPLMFKDDLNTQEIDLIMKEFLNEGSTWKEEITGLVSRTHRVFRPAIFGSVASGLVRDEMKTINEFRNPVALIHFENDVFTPLNYLQSIPTQNIWRNSVQQVKSTSHCGFVDQPAAFNRLLAEYAQSVFAVKPVES